MPIPRFIAELRAHVGHSLLWLTTARAVVVDDLDRVILGREVDSTIWTFPGGVIDPAEHPADAAVRECFEETGIVAVPEALTSVTVSPVITHASGDVTQHLDITFRCRAVGGEPRPHDGEFEDVRWYPINRLPDLDRYYLGLLRHAVDNPGQTAYTFSGHAQVLGAPSASATH